jgi:uncharacterized protein YbjT (DUF2867 family)
MSKILVIGSTGNVGSRLVRLLSSRGHAVRALARTGERARFDGEVEVVIGDLMDSESLRRALDGVSRLYLLSPAIELEEHDANAIEAAKEARLELVVKHSVTGAQHKATDITRWHGLGEDRLKTSGLPCVFLRPASFTSNSLGWVSTVKSEGTVYGALGDAALPVIDPEDIAEVAATVLTTPGHAGKAYELTGPESLTTAEQVATLGSVLGRPLTYVNISDSALREAMSKTNLPAKYVDARIGLVQLLRRLGRVAPTPDVKSVLGRQPRTFRQWAEANVAAFR